jgi:hypothetical protein
MILFHKLFNTTVEIAGRAIDRVRARCKIGARDFDS